MIKKEELYYMDRKRDDTIRVLCGGNIPSEIPHTLSLIAESLDHPKKLTENVEEICEGDDSQDYRYHLIRMQLDTELNMREDVDYNSRRLWIAQTLEKLIFGKLKIDGSSEDEDS